MRAAHRSPMTGRRKPRMAGSSPNTSNTSSGSYRSPPRRDDSSDDEEVDIEGSPVKTPPLGRRTTKQTPASGKSTRSSTSSSKKSPPGASSPIYPDLSQLSTDNISPFKAGSPYGASPTLKEEGIKPRKRLHGTSPPSRLPPASPRGKPSTSPYPKPRTNASNNTNNEEWGPLHWCCLTCIVVGVIFLVYVFVLNPAKSEVEHIHEDIDYYEKYKMRFTEEIDELKEKFSHQDHKLWRVIKASAKSVMRPTPLQPGVLLLAATRENQNTAVCLANQVGTIINKVGYSKYVQGVVNASSDLSGFATKSREDDIKLELDERLTSIFDVSKVAVIHEIHALPGASAMIFYKYCDHETAAYKDVIIIMTVTLRGDSVGSNWDKAVEADLGEAWASLDTDRLTPLLSRVANSIVVVAGEGEDVLRKYC